MPKGHYKSQFRRGGRNSGRTVPERFWEKVQIQGPSECWPWQGAVFQIGMGYGQFQFEGRPHSAHRIAWLLTKGPIPAGSRVLHHCDNPPCCNPVHLFIGSNADNMKDMASKGRARPYRGGVFGDRNGTRTKPESRPRGEAHPRAVLTESQVLELRRLHREGVRQIDLGRRFGLSRDVVSKIINRRSWKHLP